MKGTTPVANGPLQIKQELERLIPELTWDVQYTHTYKTHKYQVKGARGNIGFIGIFDEIFINEDFIAQVKKGLDILGVEE